MSLELSHIFKEEETILQITMGILKKKIKSSEGKTKKEKLQWRKGGKANLRMGLTNAKENATKFLGNIQPKVPKLLQCSKIPGIRQKPNRAQ